MLFRVLLKSFKDVQKSKRLKHLIRVELDLVLNLIEISISLQQTIAHVNSVVFIVKISIILQQIIIDWRIIWF